MSKKIVIFAFLFLVVLGAGFGVAGFVEAQTAAPALDVGLQGAEGTGLSGATDVRLIVARAIRTVLGLLGIIAVVIVLYGGFSYMTAGGNEEKVATAKKILVNGGIGLILILSSFAITSFVINRLVAATTQDLSGENCVGADCPAPGGSGGTGFTNAGTAFYVSSLPAGGELCVRNVHPVIVFSQEVDLATLAGNISVTPKGGSAVVGAWQYGDQKSTAVFVPTGVCAPGAGEDCLLPKTAYTITFTNPAAIKSADGKLSLNCAFKGGCGPVTFVTGEGIDRLPPTITITEPLQNASFQAGAAVPVKVSFTDDNGLQNLAVYQAANVVGSKSLVGCQKTGTVELAWSTTGLNSGQYSLNAVGLDWSGGKGTASALVNLRPNHCFNNLLESDLGEKEVGPPACGGECGRCSGESCQVNGDCGSGFCQVPAAGGAGVCVQRATITSLTPNSGAPGTYVTISGKYFGSARGHVYFAAVKNPSLTEETDWIEGKPVSCGTSFASWTSTQIIVEVPEKTVAGPVAVFTGKAILKKGAPPNGLLVDTTRDAWGPLVGDFTVTNEVRPSICALNPTAGKSGASVALLGKNFGLLNSANNQVLFDGVSAVTRPDDWLDSLIKTTVPNGNEGTAAVKVVRNGLESNTVTFTVQGGASESAPFITALSANTGARGEYLTISGRKFGNKTGAVWFKATPSSEAILGSFAFPETCQGVVWRDDQIIVKFPVDRGEIATKYYVQIKTAENVVSLLDSGSTFTLASGLPRPGICKISPLSGPIPFAVNQSLSLAGEYFGASPKVYFWKTGANGNDIATRALVEQKDLLSAKDGLVTLRPPSSAQTGPVVIARGEDAKLSNPVNFTVANCVQNNGTCPVAGYACCTAGAEVGVCKPAGELCSSATRSAGYVWRFSSAAIPVVPHVLERCDAQTDQGRNLPSPSPSIIWDQSENGDHHNVCRTALATVELTAPIDQKTVTPDTVIVNECSSLDDKNKCLNPKKVTLTPDSYVVKNAFSDASGGGHSYLQLSGSDHRWNDAAWYQVVLTKGIRSTGNAAGNSLALAADKPCEAANSAYCYVFKTDSKDCSLKAVVITPYSYWTKVLEAPIKFRASIGEATDLYYRGNGLSNQRCIMMDVSGYAWNWRTQQKDYAAIHGSVNAPVTQVSALANTVGIGLVNPEDATNVIASASINNLSYEGVSPLTIDLSDPAVVDYWPRCLEACTNAEVGLRFNTTMSLRNLPGTIEGGSVQLLKCNDENCLSTTSVLSLNDVSLDPANKYAVLKIANSLSGSSPLEPNTLYKVVVSAASTDPNAAINQLWSAAKLNQPLTSSKPFNQAFTWRFRTKKELCSVDRTVVTPPQFFGQSITEKTLYNAQPYGAPDACNSQGQKLNPWSVNWNWTTTDPKVAVVTSFSTKGNNPSCTASCVRKGSDVPAAQAGLLPVCGNGIVEAGEDCDKPDAARNCSLKCLFLGNTTATCGNGIVESNVGEACDPKDPSSATGCSLSCRHLGSSAVVKASEVGASICGNATVGSGEDCDTGIAERVGNPLSKLNCSEKCLHTGARLSKQWCLDNQLTRGGFTAAEFSAACGLSFSQCGDGIATPDEDPGCDVPQTGWNSGACNQFCLKKSNDECVPNSEGCDANGRYSGSSLLYTNPSSCGDGVVGTGENAVCEASLIVNHDGLVDPWVLASGVGFGVPQGSPPAQTTLVKATAQAVRPVTGSGVFSIACGYTTELECKRTFGEEYSVGENTCCYRKPHLVSTYPANNAANVCPNTYLEAVFDSKIDETTLAKNVVIARGSSVPCAAGQEDVTILVAARNSLIVREPWYKHPIATLFTRLREIFLGEPVAAVDSKVNTWCVALDGGVARVVPGVGAEASGSKISIALKTPLAFATDYAVILKEGVKDIYGVSIGKTAGKNTSWHFATADKICEINKVTVAPSTWSFTQPNATTTLEAAALTTANARIQPIPDFYDWEYVWGPRENPYVSFQATNTSLNTIAAQNRNGEIDARAEASITTNKYTSAKGGVASGSSHLIVFLCENPWPPQRLTRGAEEPLTIFPYEDKVGNNDAFDISKNAFTGGAIPTSAAVADGYFNFGTYYCADSGSTGTGDDLPYLRPSVQTSGSAISAAGALKKFFFTNEKNADAIGIQVFANPKHLLPSDWYALGKASGGQGFVGDTQNTTVNGYNAITDGNNIYVDALNYSAATKNIYSTIYLFSINANATPESRKVFEQVVTNLTFNTNLNNFGYCGMNVDNPGFQVRCQSDLDCSGGQVCSATVDKLKRNYERLRGLNRFQTLLASYADQHSKKFPDLQEGSYLTGQSVSTWPSWDTLGNTLGQRVPVDPINQLATAGTCSVSTNKFCTVDKDCGGSETCVLHDPITAWSAVDRRFSFACPPPSYAYRYMALPAGASYLVRARFENPGIAIANFDTFLKDFINPEKFITGAPSGICNQDQEIATLNTGVCGDGVVNSVRGEECDPVGQTRYGACSAVQANKIQVDVCDSSCHWKAAAEPFVACSFLSKCGNSKVENGETCDDGALNGRYNHCAADCKGFGTKAGFCGDGVYDSKFEVCDYKVGALNKKGVCTSGPSAGSGCNTDNECNFKNNVQVWSGGVCDMALAQSSEASYALNKTDSCSFTCLQYGQYCGDGKVQSEYGEQCDGDQVCEVNGVKGVRYCNKDCSYKNESGQPVAWWRFDDVITNSKDTIFRDELGKTNLICNPGSSSGCPYGTNGQVGKGIKYRTGDDHLRFGRSLALDLDSKKFSGEQSMISIAAWVKIDAIGERVWKNIITKLRSTKDDPIEKAYTFAYFQDKNAITKLAFTAYEGSLGEYMVTLPTQVPVNQWHHVAVTAGYDAEKKYSLTFYLDGEKISENLNVPVEGSVLSGEFASFFNNGSSSYTANKYPVAVGQLGSLDELRVYNRLLIPTEVKTLAGNNGFCVVGGSVKAAETGPTCGDGRVDAGEACDNAGNNGVSCNPAYSKTCSYCAYDCKNIIDVQPKAYCGDGVVQGPPLGNEVCDRDGSDSSLYLSSASSLTQNTFNIDHQGFKLLSCTEQPQADYTQKKEITTPACGALCTFPGNNCITCGSDPLKGVEVSGSLLNVLTPNDSNPLRGISGGRQSKIDVYVGPDIKTKKAIGRSHWIDVSTNTYFLRDPSTDPITSETRAKINSYPLCSTGDPRYTLRLNGDSTHRFDFPVFAASNPEQYDLILSPVINKQLRPNDIRIVVSWVKDANLYGGFTIPLAGKGKTEGTLFAGKLSSGTSYFTGPRINGIGYHGFGLTANKTSEEAFFVNTDAKASGIVVDSEMTNDQYAFYVRTEGGGISRLRSIAKLKVDVYFPENDAAENHFAIPSLSFYLSNATASDNAAATYWHVFNIKRANVPVPQAVESRIIPVNRIVTESKFF